MFDISLSRTMAVLTDINGHGTRKALSDNRKWARMSSSQYEDKEQSCTDKLMHTHILKNIKSIPINLHSRVERFNKNGIW
jgi:hypothetical protein